MVPSGCFCRAPQSGLMAIFSDSACTQTTLRLQTSNRLGVLVALSWLVAMLPAQVQAQSVCLPLPRLLSIMPMGGTVGTTLDVTITGENTEDVRQLIFQHPGIVAVPKQDANGRVEPNKFQVTIAPDCPLGLVEARVLCRLGISSARIFSVGALPEVIQTQPNTALSTAMNLPVNSVCNAVVAAKSLDHYAFEAEKGKRYVIHCASRGIDSKLDPVVIIADATGRDLVVERRGETLDFTAQASGRHIIKVHELTFKGGPGFFYRLTLQELPADATLPSFPATQLVSSFSWPPGGLPQQAATPEDETVGVQSIQLPGDISGRFFPAADSDTYQFEAQQGQVWWIEVASERLGRPTDPSIVIQRAQGPEAEPQWVEVLELNDIASPMKPSSNGYAYDGPPFDGGSTDILGKFEVKETGTYRLLLTDLFGGTRRDARNQYRLVIRQAQPDFALAAWGLHMELRNGDRNALSKPLALRAGATVALEVVAVRRDGFDGAIELSMSGLPAGVTAKGLEIPSGKTRGIVLLTAALDAPEGLSEARLEGTASIAGRTVTRPVQLAQMAWPVTDAWGEIPSPRLVQGIPVSISLSERAPLTIAASERKVWEVKAGEKLTIPLTLTSHGEFSGSVLSLKTLGAGLESNPKFDISLTSNQANGVVNLGVVKAPPGDYAIAFYGTAVAKYQYNPLAIPAAQVLVKEAESQAKIIAEQLQQQMQVLASLPDDKKEAAQAVVAELSQKKQAADAAVTSTTANLKALTEKAAPRDTAEIVISEPIAIRVQP